MGGIRFSFVQKDECVCAGFCLVKMETCRPNKNKRKNNE